ncbi:hypothetical protein GCM10018792_07410 [Streptomyces rubradiris]|nr:hypothetical protein GCM10018792_07410 [Streptomyces rubradiris]
MGGGVTSGAVTDGAVEQRPAEPIGPPALPFYQAPRAIAARQAPMAAFHQPGWSRYQATTSASPRSNGMRGA